MILLDQSPLEFQLRFQQYIELRRNGQVLEARQHAQKYIAGNTDAHSREIYQASGLLAYSPNTEIEPYKVRTPPPLPVPGFKQFSLFIIYSHIQLEELTSTRMINRAFTPETDGPTSSPSSSKPTTNYFHYPNDPSSTSPSVPASPRSKLPPATPNISRTAPTPIPPTPPAHQ